MFYFENHLFDFENRIYFRSNQTNSNFSRIFFMLNLDVLISPISNSSNVILTVIEP